MTNEIPNADYEEIVLVNNDYFTALIRDINHAKKSIRLEVYIFEFDLIGKQIATALSAAASRGVKVRVLVDGFGSLNWGNEDTLTLENAGVATRIYHPLPWIISHWWRAAHAPAAWLQKIIYLLAKINSRTHRKFTVIDDSIVYIGSANITNGHHNNETTTDTWRDTSIRITGIDLSPLITTFEIAWSHFPIHKRIYFTSRKNNMNSIFRLNYFWRQRHHNYKALLQRIRECENRIWVTNAYFVPDSKLLKNLIAASKRGVDVRILLPHKSDVPIMPFASSIFYDSLLRNGATIYEYLPGILHAKILILDDWISVGSSNLNYRSIKHDLEIDVTIQTPQAKSTLIDHFLSDLEKSKKINLIALQSMPRYKYFIGKLLLIIRYWL